MAWGDTALTLMLYGANCLARVFVNASTPAFEGPYPGAEVMSPIFPAIEETLIIFPYLCCLMIPATALQQLNVPLRLTSMPRSHSSTLAVPLGPLRMTPALSPSRST